MDSLLLNPDAERFFLDRSAHDEVGTALLKSLERLGDYEVRGDLGNCKAPYAVTAGLVFCGASGMNDTYWRLRPADHAIALASGADPADLGPDWVRIALFRPGWPQVDLAHWALRAYEFARTGN